MNAPIQGRFSARFFPYPVLAWRWLIPLALLATVAVRAATLDASVGGLTNYVLELDGNESYIELPPNAFNHLEDATIEGWVKWQKLGEMSRILNYGEGLHDLSVCTFDPHSLTFVISEPKNNALRFITVPGLAIAGTWFHFAAVSGRDGM